MSNSYASASDDYLASTRSVLQAARWLREDLNADVARREFAIEQLEEAAEQQRGGAESFRAFMFTELEPSGPEEGIQERVAEDTLASIAADLHVANVLIAAGETTGET